MSLELILGPMFAGKSSAILRIVNRYKSINRSCCILSHSIDNRYTTDQVITNHDQLSLPCFRFNTLMAAKNDANNEYLVSSNVIIIDEAQFFPDIVEFVLWLVEDLQKDVIVVGLDGDANRKPFGRLLELVPLADRITKLKSFCSVCLDGTDALFTFCKGQKDEQILVGGSELYMPLCRKHYIELSK